MIHSEEAINLIRRALVSQGIKNGDVLDEMMDHYLSEIEVAVSNGKSYQTFLDKSLEKIQTEDFTLFRKKSIKRNFILASFLIFASCTSAFYILNIQPKNLLSDPAYSLEAPKGWPLKDGELNISSKFGMREHPVQKTLRLHKGVDIKASIGESVYATGDGIIEEAGYDNLKGNYIIIKHNEKYSSSYFHLDSLKVKVNDFVTRGFVIGTSGNSGSSFGPHLHYEIIESNMHIDPLKYART